MERRQLRTALREAAPWLEATDFGPRAVDAGNCDACGSQPRLLPTCGPQSPGALCRDCAERNGADAWCVGHQRDGADALDWARQLPDNWADIVTAWWVATGELHADTQGVHPE